MMKSIRILLVWGSETNNTQGYVTKFAKKWQDKNNDNETKKIVVDVVQGDDVASSDEKWNGVTSENYDYLIVATSSYGEGDPPSGFGRFFYRLQEAAKNDSSLQGMQHAVLGIGSTCYETFQNCPRHVDKYLGEAGSRRFQKRFEWDEMEHSDSDVFDWAEDTMNLIIAMNNEENQANDIKDHVCSWENPKSLLLPKIVDEDGYEIGQGPPKGLSAQIFVVGAGLVAAGAAYWYKNYYNTIMTTQADSP